QSLNNSSTVTSAVTTAANIGVTDIGPSTFEAGGNIAYTIAVSNDGPADAQSVSLTDALPSGTTLVSMKQTSRPSFLCTNASTVTCTIPTLAAGAKSLFTLMVRSSSSAASGSTLSNTASLTSTTNDPIPSNNSATSSATATTSADLVITNKGPTALIAGQTFTYTLTVRNNGPSDAATVAIEDPLPASTTFVSETQTSGPGATGTNPAAGTNATVQCSIAVLRSGESAAFTIVARVSDTVAMTTTIADIANVSSATPDPNTSNNSASTSAVISLAVSELSVTKS